MILTGSAVKLAVECGDIIIAPFDEQKLNPNSYSYGLGEELLQVRPTDAVFDPKVKPEAAYPVQIPSDGLVLAPGYVYLSHTAECLGSTKYAMSLIGRSSIGRLGLFVQIDADLGHEGSSHRWTLELIATQSIRIYPGMVIGQICFWKSSGQRETYSGPYGDAQSPLPARPESLFGLEEL